MKRLDPFYPVVPNVERLHLMLAGGARLIQLRAKSPDPAWLRQQIAAALVACRTAGAQLVVNDHWMLAIELGADFVHLGQEDLQQADLPALRRAGLRLGISTHDHAELQQALAARADYIALGPIWPTTLKVMPWAPQGLARLGEWKRRIGTVPLVAIGGITLARIPDCLTAGADVVAVVNDVVNHADPVTRAAAWFAASRRAA